MIDPPPQELSDRDAEIIGRELQATCERLFELLRTAGLGHLIPPTPPLDAIPNFANLATPYTPNPSQFTLDNYIDLFDFENPNDEPIPAEERSE